MASSQKLDIKIHIKGCSWSIIIDKEIKPIAHGVCKVSQVGDTLIFMIEQETYGLKKGMPVVLQSEGDKVVFIFKSPEDEDAMFGLATSNSSEAQDLAELLRQMMHIEEPATEEEKKEETKESCTVAKYGNKLASVISKGGKLGLSTIDKGTAKTKQGIKIATRKAKEKIPKKQEATKISEDTKEKVQKAKMASAVAVNVSAAMIKGALEAANQMSDTLAPALNDYLQKKGLKSDKPAGPKTEATINVGKQSVKAALELYIAMKDASIALMAASLEAGAEIIEHRYGDEAGALARDAKDTVNNALSVSQNLGGLGVKATAKKVMVQTVLKSVDGDDCEKKETAEESKVSLGKPPETGAALSPEPSSSGLALAVPDQKRETSKALQMD